MKKCCLNIFLLLVTFVVYAQKEIPVKVNVIDKERLPFQFKQFEKPISKEEFSFKTVELRNELLKAGYATASIDSAYIKEDTAFIKAFLGEVYTIKEVMLTDSSKQLLSDIGLGYKWDRRIVLSNDYLDNLQENLLVKLEEHGYPYASVAYDNATLLDQDVQLSLVLKVGPYMKFDTIHNVNKAAISKGYLSTYLGIKPGRRYDESLVRTMDEKLQELPFVQLQKPSRVWFSSDNEAHIQVFLKEKKVSKFDFLIGVLPNNDNSGNVLITGEAGVSLWNIFGTGKKIEVGWKRLQPKSQELKVYFDYPYILSSSFGADLNFELDKQDTSFLDLDWAIGLQYLLRGRDRLKLVVQNTQTFLLEADTAFIRNNGKLPPILDQSTLLTGVDVYFEKLDYLYNPSKGWELGVGITAGFKKIKRNNSILQFELPDGDIPTAQLYDSLSQRSVKFEVQWMGNYYWSFAKRQVLKIGLNGGAIYNEDLLTNELHRIGGNDRLRGFDEASIFSSLFNVTTLEYRYLLDKNAFLSLFFDWAYTEQRLKDSFSNDFPFGFGLGLNFETKAGIFGVSYALGRQNGNPIDFKSSKIHFGYVNIF